MNYGSVEYWNSRYTNESGPSFDWLFNFSDVRFALDQIINDKTKPVLVPGCGNAPFSEDIYFNGGYHNIFNIDISDTAIEQMSNKHGDVQGLRFYVMDVLNLQFDDGYFSFIIDKSLIDTLMCYNNGTENTKKMMREINRVLSPGGRYITFSLHSVEEVERYFQDNTFGWKVSCFRIKSSRFNETQECRRRSVAHTMVVCDKAFDDGTYAYDHPLVIDGTMTEDEYQKAVAFYEEVNFKAAMSLATTQELVEIFSFAFEIHFSELSRGLQPKEQKKWNMKHSDKKIIPETSDSA